MTNLKYLNENKLYEAHKQFMRMCNEGYIGAPIEEAGEADDDTDTPSDTDSAPENAPDTNGDEMNQGTNAPDGNEPNQSEPTANDGSEPNNNIPDNGTQDEPMQGDTDDMPIDGMEDSEDSGLDDDVLDVEDLTDAQEKLNKKENSIGRDLGAVDDRITKLVASIDKMEKMIDGNNDEIKNLKGELEKRVPTQVEKMNLRSLNSYPFNVSPQDYWKDKEKSGKYDVSGDDSDEYKITNDDIDNYNEQAVQNSFEVDDELNQTMKKIFGEY